MKLSEGSTAVGTKLALTTLFKGKESEMEYTVKEWNPPHKVVVEGDSPTVGATDEIVFTDGATPGTTHIAYTADIRLKGFLSLFTFLVASDIKGLAISAKAGMEEAFKSGAYKTADKA